MWLSLSSCSSHPLLRAALWLPPLYSAAFHLSAGYGDSLIGEFPWLRLCPFKSTLDTAPRSLSLKQMSSFTPLHFFSSVSYIDEIQVACLKYLPFAFFFSIFTHHAQPWFYVSSSWTLYSPLWFYNLCLDIDACSDYNTLLIILLSFFYYFANSSLYWKS